MQLAKHDGQQHPVEASVETLTVSFNGVLFVEFIVIVIAAINVPSAGRVANANTTSSVDCSWRTPLLVWPGQKNVHVHYTRTKLLQASGGPSSNRSKEPAGLFRSARAMRPRRRIRISFSSLPYGLLRACSGVELRHRRG